MIYKKLEVKEGSAMGKIVLITGGSSGIGRAAAEYLAAKGCRVYEVSRRGESFGRVSHITASSVFCMPAEPLGK